MSDCCTDDLLPQALGLPGRQGGKGDTGQQGNTGPAGKNSFGVTTASFVMPSTGAVTVFVDSTTWPIVGQTVFIQTAGYFTVTAIASPTSLTLTVQNVPSNAAGATVIATAKKIGPGGVALIDSTALTGLDSRVTALEGGPGGITTYYSGTQPSGPGIAEGDIWFDTAHGNKMYRWDGTGWQNVQRVIELADFGTGIKPIQKGATLPGSGAIGDFFLLTTDMKLYKWTGSAWSKALAAGDLVGQVDASTFLVDGTIIAQKMAANSVTAVTVGANQIITNAANIADAVITSAKIANLAAGKITVGDLAIGVRMNAVSGLYNVGAPGVTFKSREFASAAGNAFGFGAASAFGFSMPNPATLVGPGNGSAGTYRCFNPDGSGTVTAEITGTLIGYTGNITVFYQKNQSGSFIPLGAISSADSGNAHIFVIRGSGVLGGIGINDRLDFYVAPCDGNGNIPSLVTCRYEIDVMVHNF